MTAADYERLAEQTLDEMVAAGEITEQQRDRVFFARFLAADESRASMTRKTIRSATLKISSSKRTGK
jgi:hypothetical protein